MWLLWAVWTLFLVPLLPDNTWMILLDNIGVKALIWIGPLLCLKRLRFRELFRGKFPWLPCVALLCAATAFLHTVRLLNGLQESHVIFDPMMIVLSLAAGVIEELSFRGGFFTWEKDQLPATAVGHQDDGLALREDVNASPKRQFDKVFWQAAILNGVMFTLYHYPELLRGQWQGLISLRALLIFTMGIVFCWMYKRWQNLALNMTVHTVWNVLSYLFCLAG